MYRTNILKGSACWVALLLCSIHTAHDAWGIAFTTNASGNWTGDTGALGTWSPDGGPHFFPISGDTAQFGNHNVTVTTPQVFSGGGISVGQNPFITLNDDVTMDSGTFTFSPTSLVVIGGNGGEWHNDGTFNHTNNQILFFDTVNGNFNNNNTYNFTGNGTFRMRQNSPGTARFVNTGLLEASGSGGEIDLQSTPHDVGITNTGIIRADGAPLQINVQLQDTTGTIEAINGGAVQFASLAIFGAHDTASTTTFTTNTGGSIQLGGLVDQFRGTITPGSDVRIGEDLRPNQALSYLDFGSTQIGWGDAASQGADITLVSGRVFEFRSPVNFDSTALQTINGDGTVRNVAGNTFTMSSSAFLYLRAGATFENNGTLIHSGSGEWRLDGAGGAPGTGTFVNNGTYQAPAGSRQFNGSTASPAQTFDNQGIVEVDATAGAATFTITANTVLPQFGSNTLSGGTWRVSAVGANNATLNLDPANAGITTIGAGAVVELSETGAGVASIAEMGGLANVNGVLRINGTKVFSTSASGLAIGPTGTIGGDGTIAETLTFTGGTLSPGASAGTLNVTGNVLLDSASTLDYELSTPNIVGGPNDLVEITGNLTLDGTLVITELPGFGQGIYRLFNVSGSITDNGLLLPNSNFTLQIQGSEVNLIYFIVPEPSSLVLCSLAGLVLLRRRRKK